MCIKKAKDETFGVHGGTCIGGPLGFAWGAITGGGSRCRACCVDLTCFVGSFALDDKQAIVIIVVSPTSSTLMLFSMLRCHVGPVWSEKLSWMHWAECQEGAMHGL